MHRYIGLTFALLACSAPATSRAQSREDVQRADSLFNAAKALTDAGNYPDACSKFAESKRLAPGLGVTLFLADCYEKVGRTASAWIEFRSAEAMAKARQDTREEVARQRAQALEPRLNRLAIELAPTIPRDGIQVLCDGSTVPSEELGSPVPVDPGEHTVVVSGPGRAPRTFTAHSGADHLVAVVYVDSVEPANTDRGSRQTPAPPPFLPSAHSPPASAEVAPSPVRGDSSPDPGATRKSMGLAAGALGVVGIGVGSALGLMAKSQLDQSNQAGNCNALDQCTEAGRSKREQALNLATGSTVAFIAGGVLLGAGVIVYFTAPRRSVVGVEIAPLISASGGGALLSASF